MGGSGKTTQTETPTISGFPAAPGTYTLPPAPLGFIEALAAQLQAGYGGNQRAYLNTIYRPMTFTSYHALGVPAAKAPPAAGKQGGAPGARKGAGAAPASTLPIEQLLSRTPSGSFDGR